MTRGTKLGGGALLLVVVCLAGWHVFRTPNLSARIRRHLPRSVRRLLAPKPQPSTRMANLPNVYLWAWERPEDLQFLPERKVGVAFLAKTIYIAGRSPATAQTELAAPKTQPRMQPLRIVPGTPLTAVIRIESARGALPSAYTGASASPQISSNREEIARIASEISSTAQITGVSALQIDFDATLSEHAFYRDLLVEVRKELPPDFPLSITALASWCIGDRWLDQLPPGTVDEAVPMLFRMGTGASEITGYLARGNDFAVPACSTSLGLSTDEPFSQKLLSGDMAVGLNNKQMRLYLFSPKSWDPENTKSLLKEVGTWHEN